MIHCTKQQVKLFFLLLLSLLNVYSQNESLSLESIWKSKKFIINHKEDLQWTPNGSNYTQIVYHSSTKLPNILRFDLASGILKDTLLHGELLRTFDKSKDWIISEYALSSSEKNLLFAVNEEPIYRHSTQAEYYILNLESKKITPLCSCFKVSLAEFSPDGKSVSFVRENNLYIKDIASNKEIQVSFDGLNNHILNGIPDWVYEEEFSIKKAYSWSSDGRFLAYLKFDESKVPLYSLQKWGDGLYPFSEKYRYPKAGENSSEIKVMVYDLNSKTEKKIAVEGNSELYIPRLNFFGANNLIIQTLNRHQNKWTVLNHNPVNQKTDTVIFEKSETYIEITEDLHFFEQDQKLIYTTDKNGFRHIYAADLKSKTEKTLTKGEWEVDKIVGFDKKTGWVYFLSNKEGFRFKNLYRVNVLTEETEQLAEKNGNYAIRLSPDGKFFIQTFSTLTTPPVVSVHLHDGRLIRFLEKNTEMADNLLKLKLPTPEFTTLTTADEVELEACLIKPKDFDKRKKYPTVFFVYGGPNYQVVLDKWQYGNYLWHQFLAQQGYLVVMVDPRGSGGKGKAFSHVNYLKLGKYETRDVVEAAKTVAKWPFVDAKNIGIWGWSYGGYLSTLALAFGNDVFQFAIAVAPVTSWKFYDNIYTERYLRTPKENPKGYEEYSPLNHVDEIKGKYLLVHGTADDNVHIQHSMLMQKAMVDAGKQLQYFVYTDKNHGIYGGNTRHHLYTMMFEFIKNSKK